MEKNKLQKNTTTTPTDDVVCKEFTIYDTKIKCTRGLNIYDEVREYYETIADTLFANFFNATPKTLWDTPQASTWSIEPLVNAVLARFAKYGIKKTKKDVMDVVERNEASIKEYLAEIYTEREKQIQVIESEMVGVNELLRFEANSKVVGNRYGIIGSDLDIFIHEVGGMIRMVEQAKEANEEAAQKSATHENRLAMAKNKEYVTVADENIYSAKDSIKRAVKAMQSYENRTYHVAKLFDVYLAEKYNVKSGKEITNTIINCGPSVTDRIAWALKEYPYNPALIERVVRSHCETPELVEMAHFVGAGPSVARGNRLYHQDELDKLGYPQQIETMDFHMAMDFIHSLDGLDIISKKCLTGPVASRISQSIDGLLFERAGSFRNTPESEMQGVATGVVDAILDAKTLEGLARVGLPIYAKDPRSLARESLISLVVEKMKEKKLKAQNELEEKLKEEFEKKQASFGNKALRAFSEIGTLINGGKLQDLQTIAEIEDAEKFKEWRKKRIAQLDDEENEQRAQVKKQRLEKEKELKHSGKELEKMRASERDKAKKEAEDAEKVRIAEQARLKKESEQAEKARIAEEKKRQKEERAKRLKQLSDMYRKTFLIVQGALLLAIVISEIAFAVIKGEDILASVVLGLVMGCGVAVLPFIFANSHLKNPINKLPRTIAFILSWVLGIFSVIMALAAEGAIQIAVIFAIVMCIASIVILTVSKKALEKFEAEDKK